jgi:hypothetical protein
MRSKWVDLMMHRGTIACAEIRFKRNNSPSNFKAMCHARVMYEAAVEAIGKDVIDKSMETEDARASTCSVATQAAAHKDLRPRDEGCRSTLSDRSRISTTAMMKAVANDDVE